MPRAQKSHIQEKNILLQKQRGKDELTQKKKLFDLKCSLTLQFCVVQFNFENNKELMVKIVMKIK